MVGCNYFGFTNPSFPTCDYTVFLFNAGNVCWYLCYRRNWSRIINGICRTNFAWAGCLLWHWSLYDGCIDSNNGMESVGKSTVCTSHSRTSCFYYGIYNVAIKWLLSCDGNTGFGNYRSYAFG